MCGQHGFPPSSTVAVPVALVEKKNFMGLLVDAQNRDRIYVLLIQMKDTDRISQEEYAFLYKALVDKIDLVIETEKSWSQ